ncbi:MAG: hypothetical protein PHC38_05200, partial [Weeksellaceae bacterium]|nr:hypothetical protein [Weeksellaceae bacterium]
DLVDEHVKTKKNHEFSIQQKILADNNSDKNQFLAIDMEYQFEQKSIKERTENKTRFDIVAIDLANNKIVLLELKQGFASSDGNSGVLDHIKKYQEHINHLEFSASLIADIKSILRQKELLGIYQFTTKAIIENLCNSSIDFKVIFAYKTIEEKERYKKKYGNDGKTLFINTSTQKYIIKTDDI